MKRYFFLFVACLFSIATMAQADRQFIRTGNRYYRLQNFAKAEAEYIASYFSNTEVNIEDKSDVPYCIRVANVGVGDVLNIRKEPTVSSLKTGQLAYNDPNKYTIIEERNGWGRLKSGIGWINLYYTKRS